MTSSRVAPSLAAALAWKAMQSSQRVATPMASAISSLVLTSSAAAFDGALRHRGKRLHHVGDAAAAQVAQHRGELLGGLAASRKSSRPPVCCATYISIIRIYQDRFRGATRSAPWEAADAAAAAGATQRFQAATCSKSHDTPAARRTAILHADGQCRCPWPGQDDAYVAYHDEEWGVPEFDSRALVRKTHSRRLPGGPVVDLDPAQARQFSRALSTASTRTRSPPTTKQNREPDGRRRHRRNRAKIAGAIASARPISTSRPKQGFASLSVGFRRRPPDRQSLQTPG